MPRWVAYAGLSALFAGLTPVLAKAGLSGVNADLATLVRTVFVVVFLAVWQAILHGVPRLGTLSGRAWLFLGLSAAATAGSWVYYYRALQAGPVAGVSAIDRASLIVAVCFAALLLGERLSLRATAGAVLITAGVLLMTLKVR
jgi:bacterial/archaeal transporter family protein